MKSIEDTLNHSIYLNIQCIEAFIVCLQGIIERRENDLSRLEHTKTNKIGRYNTTYQTKKEIELEKESYVQLLTIMERHFKKLTSKMESDASTNEPEINYISTERQQKIISALQEKNKQLKERISLQHDSVSSFFIFKPPQLTASIKEEKHLHDDEDDDLGGVSMCVLM